MHSKIYAAVACLGIALAGLSGCGSEDPAPIELRLVGLDGRPLREAFEGLTQINLRAIGPGGQELYDSTVAFEDGTLPELDPSAFEGARLWVRGYAGEHLQAIGWSTPLRLASGWRRIVLHPIGQLTSTVDRVTGGNTRPTQLRTNGLGFFLPTSGRVLMVGGHGPDGGDVGWEHFNPQTGRFQSQAVPASCPKKVINGALTTEGGKDRLMLVGLSRWCALRLDANLGWEAVESKDFDVAGERYVAVVRDGQLAPIKGPESAVRASLVTGSDLLVATYDGKVYKKTGGGGWSEVPDVVDFTGMDSVALLLTKDGAIRRSDTTQDCAQGSGVANPRRLIRVGRELLVFGTGEAKRLSLLDKGCPEQREGESLAGVAGRTGQLLVTIPAKEPRPAQLLVAGGRQTVEGVTNQNPPSLLLIAAPDPS